MVIHKKTLAVEKTTPVGKLLGGIPTRLQLGGGWIDQPFLSRLNGDSDKAAKREFYREFGVEYLVLKRTPANRLPARSSTALRGS